MDDAAWNRLDKTNANALQALINAEPPSRHRAEAQARLRDVRAAEEKRQVRERLVAAERVGILAAIEKFNQAFVNRKQKDLREVWPKVSANWLNSMNQRGTAYVASLKGCGEPDVDGEQASLRCRLVSVAASQSNQQALQELQETVVMRKIAGQWRIESITQVGQ